MVLSQCAQLRTLTQNTINLPFALVADRKRPGVICPVDADRSGVGLALLKRAARDEHNRIPRLEHRLAQALVAGVAVVVIAAVVDAVFQRSATAGQAVRANGEGSATRASHQDDGQAAGCGVARAARQRVWRLTARVLI